MQVKQFFWKLRVGYCFYNFSLQVIKQNFKGTLIQI